MTTPDEGLPELDLDSPTVTLVVSNQIFPSEDPKQEQQQAACPHCKGAITFPAAPKPSDKSPKWDHWLLGQPHPFIPGNVIRRMHVEDGVVSIFSTSDDKKRCFIDEIPFESVRLIEKGMSYEVFVDELIEADGGYEPEPEPAPSNVQTAAPAPTPNSVS